MPRFVSRKIGVAVLPRHSVTGPGEFRIFQSDLDLALVLEDEPTPVQVASLLTAYERLGHKIWFLGEVEIYTRSEWALRARLHEESGEWIQWLWQIRKIKGQLEAFKRAPSRYHREKARRSFQRAFKTFSGGAVLEPEQWNSSVLSEIIRAEKRFWPAGDRSFSGRIPFLEEELQSVPWGFVALMPHGETLIDERWVEKSRRDPWVARHWATLCAYELLLFRVKLRLKPETQAPGWESYLQSQIVLGRIGSKRSPSEAKSRPVDSDTRSSPAALSTS